LTRSDDATLQPGLTSIDCTKDGPGNVIFPFPDTGTLACPIKGKNLAKVKALRLRNTDESAYTDGSVVAASGDDSTGTVSFTSSALHALNKSEYNVAALNATNVETSTNQVMHFDLNPYIAKTNLTALDANSLPNPQTMTIAKTNLTALGANSLPNPQTMTISGFHLDKVAAVHFYITDPTKFASFSPTADPTSNDRQITIKLDATELGKIGNTAADAKLSVLLTGSSKEVPQAITLKFTPEAKPAAPAAKPAAKAGGKPAVKKP
jgi:hypothetical protein